MSDETSTRNASRRCPPLILVMAPEAQAVQNGDSHVGVDGIHQPPQLSVAQPIFPEQQSVFVSVSRVVDDDLNSTAARHRHLRAQLLHGVAELLQVRLVEELPPVLLHSAHSHHHLGEPLSIGNGRSAASRDRRHPSWLRPRAQSGAAPLLPLCLRCRSEGLPRPRREAVFPSSLAHPPVFGQYEHRLFQ